MKTFPRIGLFYSLHIFQTFQISLIKNLTFLLAVLEYLNHKQISFCP